jgi:hypothetical protein
MIVTIKLCSRNAHLSQRAQPGLQIFHNVPVIPPSKVDISVREADAIQQNVEKFCNIVSAQVQRHSINIRQLAWKM